MTALITQGTATIVPQLVLNYRASRSSRNVLHELVESQDPAVTLRSTGLRRGTLQLLFAGPVSAGTAATVLARTGLFAYSDSGNSSNNMSFYVDGDITKSQAEAGSAAWIVTVDFQETSS